MRTAHDLPVGQFMALHLLWCELQQGKTCRPGPHSRDPTDQAHNLCTYAGIPASYIACPPCTPYGVSRRRAAEQSHDHASGGISCARACAQHIMFASAWVVPTPLLMLSACASSNLYAKRKFPPQSAMVPCIRWRPSLPACPCVCLQQGTQQNFQGVLGDRSKLLVLLSSSACNNVSLLQLQIPVPCCAVAAPQILPGTKPNSLSCC